MLPDELLGDLLSYQSGMECFGTNERWNFKEEATLYLTFSNSKLNEQIMEQAVCYQEEYDGVEEFHQGMILCSPNTKSCFRCDKGNAIEVSLTSIIAVWKTVSKN